MLIRHSYDRRFTKLMDDLHNKYGEEMFELEGIGAKHLDINTFSKTFFKKKNAADGSVDSNANVADTSVLTWEVESSKPLKKFNGLYLVWKGLFEMYGIKRANELIELEIKGNIRLNDLVFINKSYCYATSLRKVLEEGISYNKKIHSGPVKHFDSFINLSLRHMCYTSNQIAGAISVPDLLIYASYYILKDFGTEWDKDSKVVTKINQLFQNWIYSVNDVWRANQTMFTNVSVFDKYWLKEVFGEYVYGDGTKVDLDNVMKVQKMFVNELSRNLIDNPFTFPVMTAALLCDKEGHILDREFFQYVAEINAKNGLFNFFVDSDTSSLSSCCRMKNNITEANKVFTNSFGASSVDVGCYDDQTEVLTSTGWKFFKDLIRGVDSICTLNKETNELEYHIPSDYMEAEYSGIMHHYKHKSLDMLVTPNHNMLVSEGKNNTYSLIQSEKLKTKHNLVRTGFSRTNKNLETITIGRSTFKANPFFKLVGMYLGDGTLYHDSLESKKRGYEISFQIKKKREIDNLVEVLDALSIHYNKNYIKTRDCFTFRFYSKDIWDFLFPCGKTLNKTIPRILLETGGSENLKFLLDGLLCTDGCKTDNSYSFYTSSLSLKNDFEELLTLLGMPFHGYDGRLRKPSFLARDNRWIKSENKSYGIRILKNKRILNLKGFKKEVNYIGKIYCCTVKNNTMFVRRKGTVMVCGNSHRVVCINLPSIAYETGSKSEFKRVLIERLEASLDILDMHRALIQEMINGGRLPLYNHGHMFLKKQFSTLGFIGMYEALDILGMDIITKEGKEFATEILTLFNERKDIRCAKDNNIRNVEQIPGEDAAVSLCKKDAILYPERKHKYNLYSNQYIPLTKNADLIDRIEAQGAFDKSVGGGSILHINLEEEISPEQVKKLVEFCASKGVTYFAINYNFSQCPDCSKVYIGKMEDSPCCNKPVKKYLRVVGFLTEVSNWSEARRNEYKERQFYGSV